MLEIPRMILIGSTTRNSGKTVLATRLINRFSPKHRVMGLKISTVHGETGRCLRGGEGCGVCSSLDGPFCLTEELDTNNGKDTARMLSAGAHHVYWLRARRAHMSAAIEFALSKIERGAIIVCESNTLRRFAEPAVFLMARPAKGGSIKESACRVLPYADAFAYFDGKEFDFSVEDISIFEKKPILRQPATAVVLAGGKSTRMGKDKITLDIHGTPLIDLVIEQLKPMFEDIIVSTSDKNLQMNGGARMVTDRFDDAGPIGGIASSIPEAEFHRIFVTACDIPVINHLLVARMLRLIREHDVVVPRSPEGYLEPLHAVYTKDTYPILETLIHSGGRRIRKLYDQVDTCYLDLKTEGGIANLNTAEDYQEFLSEARERGSEEKIVQSTLD